jgi:hypothetical protein
MTHPRVAVLLVLSLLAAPVAEAADPIKAALLQGSLRLGALQNHDGGWFFLAGDSDCGAGIGASCPNTLGETALGLVAAYRITRDQATRAYAVLTGEGLKDRYTAAAPCDTPEDRPFTADVEFLVELTKIAGDQSYRKIGKAWFTCITDAFPAASARADERIDQGIHNLGAWDAAFDIRAAWVEGSRAYALAELQQVFARQADWDVQDPDCPGCEILGKANLLKAMAPVKSRSAEIKLKVAEYLAALLDAQSADGSWFGDTQITAYAVLGLRPYKTSGPTATKQRVKAAIDAAVGFLLFSQKNADGGYDDGFGHEVTEIDGEVLQALAAVH